MSAWIVFLIIALVCFIVEIYTPTMFFLNFAVAGAVCAVLSLITDNYNVLIPILPYSPFFSFCSCARF